MTTATKPEMRTPAETAQQLNVSVSRLKEWRYQRRGLHTHHKLEGQIRYAQTDIDAYLTATRVK